MAQVINLKINGLKTNPSPLAVREGALSVAKNININSPNTAQSRRGFKKYGYDLDETGAGSFNTFYNYDDVIFLHHGDEILKDDGVGGWDKLSGTYDAPNSNIGIKSVENNGSFFFTTDNGLYKMDSKTATPELAGIPKAIGMDLSLTGSSGFFTAETQLAYRVVWGKTDANAVVSLGVPSERGKITNTDNETGEYIDTKDVKITIYIPADITTDYFFQVYRSGFSAGVSTVANDELQLVYENNPTSAEITAGSITFIDNTPNSLRGATIYTAPTQEGILQSNELPPLANDIVMYKNYALYANTRTRHRKNLTLLAVSGDDGLEIGDIVTIGGVDFTGAAAQDDTVGEFEIVTSGTAAENISDTAQSLVQVINRYALNTITYAYYTSGYNELPGQMLLERRDLTDSSFDITFDKNATGNDEGLMWNPVLSSTPVTSDNESKANRIYISKFNQVDSVPTLQHVDAGGQEGAILRILALRDSVFVLKDNGEIYRIVGENPASFSILLFDNTTKLIGAKTAVVFNNQVFCFSEQGVVAISDSGVSVKSWDIEDDLREFYASSTFESNAFGISYESDRKYILFNGVSCNIYNSFTNSWTEWDVVAEAGFVNPTDDKLYWGKNDGFVYKERKNFDKFDYADDDYGVTIYGSSGTSIYIDRNTDIESNQTIHQGNTSSYITAFQDGGTDYLLPTDGHLTDPDRLGSASSQNDCFIPMLRSGDANVELLGDDGNSGYQSSGSVGTGGTFNRSSGYSGGNLFLNTGGEIDTFANSSFNGLQRIYFPKSNNNDKLGGYLEFWYDEDAFTRAFNGSLNKALFSTDGSIYSETVSGNNLVTDINGGIGPAGSASPQASGFVLTVEDSKLWLTGAATTNDFIDCEMEWTEIFASNPSMMKRFRELTVFFRTMNDKFKIKYGNNFNTSSMENVEITPVILGSGWGTGAWDSGPWGGTGQGNTEQRTYFPLGLMRALWQNIRFETNKAFTDFTINGLAVSYEEMDTEFTKAGSS